MYPTLTLRKNSDCTIVEILIEKEPIVIKYPPNISQYKVKEHAIETLKKFINHNNISYGSQKNGSSKKVSSKENEQETL